MNCIILKQAQRFKDNFSEVEHGYTCPYTITHLKHCAGAHCMTKELNFGLFVLSAALNDCLLHLCTNRYHLHRLHLHRGNESSHRYPNILNRFALLVQPR